MLTTPSTPNTGPIPARQSAWPDVPGKKLPPYRRDSRTFDTDDLTHALEVAEVAGIEEEEWAGGNLGYRKGEGEIPLEARIERVFYINLYGQVSHIVSTKTDKQEIFPEPNAEFLSTINKRDVFVYSCGSLWTSIAPTLALRGLATAIATSRTLRAKVLLCRSATQPPNPEVLRSPICAESQ